MFLLAVICGCLQMLGWVRFGVSIVVLLLTFIAAGLLFGDVWVWSLPRFSNRNRAQRQTEE
jgi:hypothetical protein